MPCGTRRRASDEAGRIVQGGHPCGERIWLCCLPRWGCHQDGIGSDGSGKGYIGKPTPTQVIEVCGRCHSDARFMRQYNPSLRSTRLRSITLRFTAGGSKNSKTRRLQPALVVTSLDKAAQRCALVRLSAARCGYLWVMSRQCRNMAPYKIPTDQLAKYKKSIHWKMMTSKGDLSAPTCNDCHGNHGAAPPGISWVGNVCGQCHPINAELFNKSRHGQLFVQMGIPGCATCHSNHEILETSDAMLGVGDKAICGNCHTPQDTGGKRRS